MPNGGVYLTGFALDKLLVSCQPALFQSFRFCTEITGMGKFEVQFLSLLLFILFLHCTGIYYFTGGFLLTRTELSATSTCDDVDASSGCILDPVRSTAEFLHRQATDGLAEEAQNSPCSNSSRGSQRTENAPQCWTKPLVTRVVVLVIDALRCLHYPCYKELKFYVVL